MSANSSYPFVSEEAKDKYLSYYDEKSRSWPPLENAEDRMVDTMYGQTFVRIGGPLDAPPLLLVPGDEETSLAWKYVVEPLSKQFRTYALDRIGDVGRSIPDPERPIRAPKDRVEWLDEVLTKLVCFSEGRRVRIVAHSYGAWQASLYALSHPERIERMVLMAPPMTVLPPRIGLFFRAVLYGAIQCRPIARWYTYWFSPISARKERSREYLNEVMEEHFVARQSFKSRNFAMPTVLTDAEWQELSVPTLFLVGDGEVMYSPEQAFERLNRLASCVKCQVVPEADHHMVVVNPDWVCNTVLQFLN